MVRAALGVVAICAIARCGKAASTAPPEHAPGSSERASPPRPTSDPVIPPRAPSIVVTGQSVLLLDKVATDDVRDPTRFHRLDGLYRFLKDFRETATDKPVPDTLIVEARPDSTTAGVFSAVQTCALSGFPHIYLHGPDATWVDGELVIPGEDGRPRNARAPETALRVTVGQQAVDLTWASNHSCAQLPDGLGTPCRNARV